MLLWLSQRSYAVSWSAACRSTSGVVKTFGGEGVSIGSPLHPAPVSAQANTCTKCGKRITHPNHELQMVEHSCSLPLHTPFFPFHPLEEKLTMFVYQVRGVVGIAADAVRMLRILHTISFLLRSLVLIGPGRKMLTFSHSSLNAKSVTLMVFPSF